MAAASFPWLNNPWQGVCADDAIVALVLVVPQRPHDPPDLVDASVAAATVIVDLLFTAALTAARICADQRRRMRRWRMTRRWFFCSCLGRRCRWMLGVTWRWRFTAFGWWRSPPVADY